MRILLLFWITVFGNQLISQDIDHSTFIKASSTNYSIGLGADVPFGDLVDRFGSNFGFKLQVERQTASNWIFGIQYDFIFGNTVKEDLFENLRISNGNILGANNAYATVLQRQRGAFIGANIGKLIPLSKQYKSALKLNLSVGMFQHNIRIVDDERSFIQINDPYIKGYDRLSRGLGIKQFIGWQYLAENKRLNFYVGFEFTQGFTKSVRDYDFDKGTAADKNSRFDGTFGLRAGFILPFYGGYEAEEIYY